eukprot:gnl/Spiro4/28685_TR14193_c0_g2_i1.p1 gnl/Spiro4/28685_TR14193_c0_g2~~gnl/Spiro4/28685_TR14193_c0_g2_i1.p1  ORF type:complete len:566 (-),score=102.45 gnl/Spiro4/28685_TR14193_c0_g2_i1:82-1779(-)
MVSLRELPRILKSGFLDPVEDGDGENVLLNFVSPYEFGQPLNFSGRAAVIFNPDVLDDLSVLVPPETGALLRPCVAEFAMVHPSASRSFGLVDENNANSSLGTRAPSASASSTQRWAHAAPNCTLFQLSLARHERVERCWHRARSLAESLLQTNGPPTTREDRLAFQDLVDECGALVSSHEVRVPARVPFLKTSYAAIWVDRTDDEQDATGAHFSSIARLVNRACTAGRAPRCLPLEEVTTQPCLPCSSAQPPTPGNPHMHECRALSQQLSNSSRTRALDLLKPLLELTQTEKDDIARRQLESRNAALQSEPLDAVLNLLVNLFDAFSGIGLGPSSGVEVTEIRFGDLSGPLADFPSFASTFPSLRRLREQPPMIPDLFRGLPIEIISEPNKPDHTADGREDVPAVQSSRRGENTGGHHSGSRDADIDDGGDGGNGDDNEIQRRSHPGDDDDDSGDGGDSVDDGDSVDGGDDRGDGGDGGDDEDGDEMESRHSRLDNDGAGDGGADEDNDNDNGRTGDHSRKSSNELSGTRNVIDRRGDDGDGDDGGGLDIDLAEFVAALNDDLS